MQAGIPGLELGFSRLAQISPRPSTVIARRQDNHPQVRRGGLPAANVTTSEARLDECAAFLVLGDKLPLAGVVNQERLVEACKNSAIRLNTGEFFEGRACTLNLVEQLNHINGLKLPAFSAELSKVQLRPFLFNLHAQVVNTKLVAGNGAEPGRLGLGRFCGLLHDDDRSEERRVGKE